MRRLAHLLGLVSLVLALGGSAGAANAPPLRVLFVGNSLTAANDLPAVVAQLSGGRIEARMVAPGEFSLEDHWRLGEARRVLTSRRWDWVVLQQGPSSLLESRVDLIAWAKVWADAIRKRGAKPAVLTVWPESARSEVFPAVLRNYADAARASRSRSLPAGAAWLAAWRREPRLALYGDDAFHPSALGTYLAALVVHAGLTGGTPIGAPPLGLPSEVAATLQGAAAEALRR